MSPRARHHAELLSRVGEEFHTTTELLNSLEGMRILKLPEVARLHGTSVDTIRRRYPHKILKLSAKRVGMRLKDALSLAQPLDVA